MLKFHSLISGRRWHDSDRRPPVGIREAAENLVMCCDVRSRPEVGAPGRASVFLKLCSLVFVFTFYLPTANADYLSELKSTARSNSLAQSSTWQALLHYAPHYLGLINQGEVDRGEFYLAPRGKVDPEAELEATLDSFFRADVSGDEHPQCRFVARYAWLKERLNFDSTKLQEEKCLRYEEWFESLKPKKLTVIFPAAYLNNPSSMFGHTLLRVDPEGQSAGEKLTSYGVNYGANTTETTGLLFALRGIFGGYEGAFSVAPYYTQVLDYSEIENRDIWEYELNLTKEEILRLVRHLWELRGVTFDYYFFDENCSYHLLSLLENARPDSKLRSKTSVWVIPVDSLRIVLKQNNMLEKAVFRPSNKKTLDARFSGLTSSEKEIAKEIGNHTADGLLKLSSINDDRKPLILDTGMDLLTYRTYKQPALIKEESDYQYKLLSERSKLSIVDSNVLVIPPPRPDLGHETNRATYSLGVHNRKLFQEIAFRPAYHDILDPEYGYTNGAQIQFMNSSFRQTEGSELKLERLDILDILSLSPWDDIFKGVSWKVTTGFERNDFLSNERNLTYNLNSGAGITFKPTDSLMSFALFGPQLMWSDNLEHPFNIGVGPTLGTLYTATDNLKFLVQFTGGEYFIGTGFRTYKGLAEARYSIDKNLAVRANFERNFNFGNNDQYENWTSGGRLSIAAYF